MTTMLIPWITFWIAVSIHPEVGAMITLLVVATVPFIMRKHKFVIWDQLSINSSLAIFYPNVFKKN